MPTVTCSVEGFEHITISYPDEWLMPHLDQFYVGWEAAPRDAPVQTKERYAAVALCSQIEGIDLDKLAELPLHYYRFFRWLQDEVLSSYYEASQVPKNS